MFSPQLSTRAGRPNPFANAYRQVGNETAVASATPHRLIEMLFDGCMDALAQARGALAADLHALYGYLTMRLTAANLRNDEAAIEECQRLLSPLQEAWQAIGPQVNASRR